MQSMDDSLLLSNSTSTAVETAASPPDARRNTLSRTHPTRKLAYRHPPHWTFWLCIIHMSYISDALDTIIGCALRGRGSPNIPRKLVGRGTQNDFAVFWPQMPCATLKVMAVCTTAVLRGRAGSSSIQSSLGLRYALTPIDALKTSMQVNGGEEGWRRRR